MIENIIEALQYDYVIRALIASIMVGLMCGVIGCFIVLRNMALIGDALSHAILPGVVVGFMVAGHSLFAFFTGSVIAGFISAILITWIQTNVKTKNDAAIGIVFTAMFALGVIGISWITRQEGVHLDLKDFLFGNVLGISNQDLWLGGIILVFVLVCMISFYRYLLVSTFQPMIASVMGVSVNVLHYFLMLLLSIVVVASLQSVGVILVVAMLIIPASTAYLLTNKLQYMLVIAGLIGVLSSIGGLFIAIALETTPGPAMTLVGASFYLLAILFSSKSGIIVKFWRKRTMNAQIISEDALKTIVRLNEFGHINRNIVAEKLEMEDSKLKQVLISLKKKRFIELKKNEIIITTKGLNFASEMIRKHRIWETYLVERVGLKNDQIHEEAERMEHLLPDEFINSVEAQLGHPKIDPHGSAIPQKNVEKALKLINLEKGDMGLPTLDQMNDNVIGQLWSMGLSPNTVFFCKDRNDEHVILECKNEKVLVKNEFAKMVQIVQMDV